MPDPTVDPNEVFRSPMCERHGYHLVADHQPPGDPRLSALAARARALRAELDRLDTLVDELDPDDRADLLPRVVALREGVDLFDADLEQRAAGLVPQPPTGPTIAEDPSAPVHEGWQGCGLRHDPADTCPDFAYMDDEDGGR